MTENNESFKPETPNDSKESLYLGFEKFVAYVTMLKAKGWQHFDSQKRKIYENLATLEITKDQAWEIVRGLFELQTEARLAENRSATFEYLVDVVKEKAIIEGAITERNTTPVLIFLSKELYGSFNYGMPEEQHERFKVYTGIENLLEALQEGLGEREFKNREKLSVMDIGDELTSANLL